MPACLKIVWLRSPGKVSMNRGAGIQRAVFGFDLPVPSGLKPDRRAVDAQASVAHRDAIAGQADHALDPDLRRIAGPAEHHHVAAARQRERMRCVSAR